VWLIFAVFPPSQSITKTMMTATCCADCGTEEGGGVSLKACKSCKHVKYCNAKCQRNHWPTHKQICKQRAAELRDEALFRDPPAMEDCPICFLPMPTDLIFCISLPPATISSVPIRDFAEANKEFAHKGMEVYYPCCGKSICGGCNHSFDKSGNKEKCPFCNSHTAKTDEERAEQTMTLVAANDPRAMCVLAHCYFNGKGVQQDHSKAMELCIRSADLGYYKAHGQLADVFYQKGDMKKAKFHFEAAAIAGHEGARCNLGTTEAQSGNMERAMKHWMIAASAGNYKAMYGIQYYFVQGVVSKDAIDSTLTAYNNSCAKMRSEARDAAIRECIDAIGAGWGKSNES
jgi:TPR repeat protein